MNLKKLHIEKCRHWDEVFATKTSEELSWYQAHPDTSLHFILKYGPGKEGHIIDIGGGTGSLVDVLVAQDYNHITVLDISAAALAKSAERLGDAADLVDWIQSDVLDFETDVKYDVWHDRAAFHFLTDAHEVEAYVRLAAKAVRKDGLLVLATFSEIGPDQCSNLPVHRYSQHQLARRMGKWFTRIECLNKDHITPRQSVQNYTYCAFRRNGITMDKLQNTNA